MTTSATTSVLRIRRVRSAACRWSKTAAGSRISRRNSRAAVLSAIAVGLSLQAAGLCPRQAAVLSSPFALALFGLLMALLAIAGDLAGSLLKRDAAVKDSSRMIPGLGGMLDILDSPLLAAPAAWLFWTRLATLAGG